MGRKSWGKTTYWWTVLLLPLLAGCGASPTSSKSDGNTSIPTTNASEVAYCSTTTSYTSVANVTITGRATFQRRELFGTSGFGNGGLGAASAARPIRFAEVRVTNAAGGLIQCATTNEGGTYQFVVPQASSQHTVAVTSRSNNSELVAYVYDDPRYNNYYSITSTFTPTLSQSLSTINASATDSTVKGGAFNILDQFYEANRFLENQAQCSSLGSNFTGCADFSVAPLVTAYWKLGFNPAEYYGVYDSGISFYLPGYYRLFILGGIQGDYNSEDTDHFDNSVILHEYGHFLEDRLFKSDSPGGQHNGDAVIDPRLAWSEGWGNFFQGAVRGDPYYMDSVGNISGPGGTAATYLFFKVDLEEADRDIPNSNPTFLGEGNFREFSVARFLWDVYDGSSVESEGTDNVTNRFVDIWWSMTSSLSISNAVGWLRPSVAFRQIGHLHDFQSVLGTTSWSNLHSIEKQKNSTSDYAQYVTTTGSCSYSMSPQVASSHGGQDLGGFTDSHLGVNNDFYHLKINSQQTITLTLVSSDADGTGQKADLDLYLYNEDAQYGSRSSMVSYSELSPNAGYVTPDQESFTVTVAPGDYLINVKAFTYDTVVGTPVFYYLTLNGSRLCPSDLP
jgi:hypothetical protein